MYSTMLHDLCSHAQIHDSFWSDLYAIWGSYPNLPGRDYSKSLNEARPRLSSSVVRTENDFGSWPFRAVPMFLAQSAMAEAARSLGKVSGAQRVVIRGLNRQMQ
jgi:hypothetical protein